MRGQTRYSVDATRIRQALKPSPPRGPPDQGGRAAKAPSLERRARTRLDHARQRRLQVARAVWHRSAVCPLLKSSEVGARCHRKTHHSTDSVAPLEEEFRRRAFVRGKSVAACVEPKPPGRPK